MTTARCSCGWHRVGLTAFDLRCLGWTSVDVFRTSWRTVWSCPRCVKRAVKA